MTPRPHTLRFFRTFPAAERRAKSDPTDEFGMLPVVSDPAPGFIQRFFFAYVAFFRVIFSPSFAKAAMMIGEAEAPTPTTMRSTTPLLPPEETTSPVEVQVPPSKPDPRALEEAREFGWLCLMAGLQKHGRLVDFIQEDVTAHSDAEVGAVARVVHAGCKKALSEMADVAPVKGDAEGSSITVPEGFDPVGIKLTGNVAGAGPYEGKLQHGGWQVETFRLPNPLSEGPSRVICPAEVEL